MKDLFISAGLADAYAILEKNGIVSLQILQDLMVKKPDKFEEWFNCLGIQLRIERLCSESLDSQRKVNNRQSDNQEPSTNHSVVTQGSASTSTQNSVVIEENVSLSTINSQQNGAVVVLAVGNGQINAPSCQPIGSAEVAQSQNITAAQKPKKVYKSNKPEVVNFNLKDLLERKPVGRALLSIYKHKRIFNSTHQAYLVALITDHFTEILPDTLLVNEDIEYLAYLITLQFPNEVISTYYVDPLSKKSSKQNKSTLSKGKLRHRYKNVIKFLKSAKALDKNPSANVDGLDIDDTVSFDSDAQEGKILLQCAGDDEDATEIERLWDLTRNLRLEEIASLLKRLISVIILEWPPLRLSKNQILIERDFKQVYQITYEIFCSNWDAVFALALKYFEYKLDETQKSILDDSTSESSIDIRQFIQLPWLCEFMPPQSNKAVLITKEKGCKNSQNTIRGATKTKSQQCWRPTAPESKDGIAIFVESDEAIDVAIKEKADRLAKYRLDLRPFIIVVVDEEPVIQKVLVQLTDDHLKESHSTEQSFLCVHENCSRKFASIASLKKHALTCDKSFVRKAKDVSVDSGIPVKKPKISVDKNLNDGKLESPTNTQPDVPNEHYLESSVTNFIWKLYSKVSITRSMIQEIVTEFVGFVHNLVNSISTSLKSRIPSTYHHVIDDCVTTNVLKNLDTDGKRQRFAEKANILVTPEKVLLGQVDCQKKSKLGQKKKCYAYFIPMRQILKHVLELPNFFQTVTEYIKSESKNCSSKIYTSIFQGKRWRDIIKNYVGKIVLPLYIYYDDFEINNPLSTAAGKHKIGGLYFSIAGLPPKFASTLENVFLGQFMYTKHLKSFKNDVCFRRVVKELKFLAEEGISITVDGEETRVYFVLMGILGDNLGLNALLGFQESFNSEFFCRICRATKKATHFLRQEITSLLRNEKNYREDLQSNTGGLKARCCFNAIPFFLLTLNVVADLMHDIYLGVARYNMSRIISHCIQSGYFDLKKLNERLKAFNSSEMDRGNPIDEIKQSHLDKGCLVITAAQMSFLISYFGMIVGDLVPHDDSVWGFYLIFVEMVDIITGSTFTEETLSYLKELIRSHNELFTKLFKETLKPKFHFLTHYPTIIRMFGPPRYFACHKFESFHQLSKKYAQLVTSRVNILYTLAVKLQLQMCFRFLSNKGLHDDITSGSVIGIVQQSNIKDFIGFRTEVLSYIKINGSTYRKGCAIFLDVDASDDPEIAVIDCIIKNETGIFFYAAKCDVIGLDYHNSCYELILPHQNKPKFVVKYDFNKYLRPMMIHNTSDGNLVISVRDLE